MANTAYTKFILTGKKDQLLQIQELFIRLKNTPVQESVADNGWDSQWLGCLVSELGGDINEIYCRGVWTDIEYNPRENHLIIYIETAWRVPNDILVLIEYKFEGIKIWYHTELEDCKAIETNDTEELYFNLESHN